MGNPNLTFVYTTNMMMKKKWRMSAYLVVINLSSPFNLEYISGMFHWDTFSNCKLWRFFALLNCHMKCCRCIEIMQLILFRCLHISRYMKASNVVFLRISKLKMQIWFAFRSLVASFSFDKNCYQSILLISLCKKFAWKFYFCYKFF